MWPIDSMICRSKKSSGGVGRPSFLDNGLGHPILKCCLLISLQELELKADKHRLRQDDITLMALFRVWKAKERGRLADNGFKRRLVTAVWVVWKSRLAVISESNSE